MDNTTNNLVQLKQQGRSLLYVALILLIGIGLLAVLPHGAPWLVFVLLGAGIIGLCAWAGHLFKRSNELSTKTAE